MISHDKLNLTIKHCVYVRKSRNYSRSIFSIVSFIFYSAAINLKYFH